MKLLFDTHLLLWFASEPHLLSGKALELMSRWLHLTDRKGLRLFLSATSMWEIAMKRALNRPDFQPDPVELRRGLLGRGFKELPLLSEHSLRLDGCLPCIRTCSTEFLWLRR